MKSWLAVLVLLGGAATAASAGALPTRGDRFSREDLDADGRITRAEARAAALVLFERFDADHDGRVTRAEAEGGAHRWRLERSAMRFEALDRDHDGRLTPTELGSPRRFVWLDRNGDGRLTRIEYQRSGEPGRCGTGEEGALRSRLWRRDLDRDGQVTRMEMLRAAEQHFARKDRNRDGSLTRSEGAERRPPAPRRRPR